MSDFVVNIPGICQIIRIHKRAVGKNIAAMAACKMKPIMPLGADKVQFHGVPSLTSTKKTVDNGTLCEAKLTFRSSEELPTFGYCYVAKANSGKCLLLGTDRRCPVVNRNEDTGNPEGNTAVYTYDIVMKDVLAPIEVIL